MITAHNIDVFRFAYMIMLYSRNEFKSHRYVDTEQASKVTGSL